MKDKLPQHTHTHTGPLPAHLTGGVVRVIYEHAERVKQLGPARQLPAHGDGRDERAGSRADQRRRVADRLHRLLFNKALDFWGEPRVVDLDVVLEDEPGYGPRRLVFRLDLREHVDQVVVEVRVLIQRLQLLQRAGCAPR